MMGKTNKDILLEKLDVLTRVGLGELVTADFAVPKYTAIALQQLYSVKKQKGVIVTSLERMPSDHPTCERLKTLVLEKTESVYWFSFAEHAINAIYCFSESPDKLCAEMIRELIRRLYKLPRTQEESVQEVIEQFETRLNLDQTEPEQDLQDQTKNSFKLSQLLFFVGHVAIRQIVHLENIETEWKRRKILKDVATQEKQSDLEMVTGTVEDDFVELMSGVQERELLFSNDSILSTFSPLLSHVCTHNQKFNVF
jgi:condensin complex subunit 1